MRTVGNILFILGICSIPLSYALFHFVDRQYGLFTGLWVPSLLLISSRCHILAALAGVEAEAEADEFGACTHLDAHTFYHLRDARQAASRRAAAAEAEFKEAA